MKSVKRLTLFASLVLAAAAIMAAPASAMKWNWTGFANLNGTLTLKKGGASPVQCTVNTNEQFAEPEAEFLEIGAGFYTNHVTTCANGLQWEWTVLHSSITKALGGGKYSLCCFRANEGYENLAPWSGTKYFLTLVNEPTWLNGSSTSPSYIEFNETKVGRTNTGYDVTATGKLEVKRLSGYLYIVP